MADVESSWKVKLEFGFRIFYYFRLRSPSSSLRPHFVSLLRRSMATSRFLDWPDTDRLDKFVKGGEKARKTIQKNRRTRGKEALEYQIRENESDMALYWTSKYIFENRSDLGDKFDKDTILEDLEIFTETVDQNFSWLVHSGREIPGLPKSPVKVLLIAYKESKMMIDVLRNGHAAEREIESEPRLSSDQVAKRVRLDEDNVEEGPASEGRAFYLQMKKKREEFLEAEKKKQLEKEQTIARYTSELEVLIRANASVGKLEIVMTDVPIAEIPLVMEIYRKYETYGFVMNTEKKDIVEFTW